MIVFLNGDFVPEAEARISVFDRGFLYGDGLFETLRVHRGRIFRWHAHTERLSRGIKRLQVIAPCLGDELRGFAETLLEKNGAKDAILRINVSRGVGPRGYSPAAAKSPTVVMSVHPTPEPPTSWTLVRTATRLPPASDLSSFKTVSKLQHVMAKAEAVARGADEALMDSADTFVGQGSASNVFWVQGDQICTPSLECGILPGVTRALIVERGGRVQEGVFPSDALARAEAIFMTSSSLGVVEVSAYEGRRLKTSPLVSEVQECYREALMRECGA